MGIDALVIPDPDRELDEIVFASLFLSAELNFSVLKKIYRDLGLRLPSGARKARLADDLASRCAGSSRVCHEVIKNLLLQGHGWLTFKIGRLDQTHLPNLADPAELVTSIGKEKWYGPISHPDDEHGIWYIRPVLVPHWKEQKGHDAPQRSLIRWVCLARIYGNTVSLHWNGFSHADTADKAIKNNTQFAYWEKVPDLFDEFQTLIGIELPDVELHELILHDLWDKYRHNENYTWVDRRIRAESGGVSLNARAGYIKEISVEGIRGLAHTIRTSIEAELKQTEGRTFSDSELIDEVILRTLLREYGTLSYEFSLLDTMGDHIVRTHAYFGQREARNGPDCFPHLRVYKTTQSDLNLLRFLAKHLQAKYDSDGKVTQASLFN